MVVHVNKYNIHPDKHEAYNAWAQTVIPRILAVPGLVEFRGYRTAVGSSQVVTTFEFADMAAYAAWYAHPDIQALYREIWDYTVNLTTELWGPSPVVPEPIRPGA